LNIFFGGAIFDDECNKQSYFMNAVEILSLEIRFAVHVIVKFKNKISNLDISQQYT
jgi:hypothetical protein